MTFTAKHWLGSDFLFNDYASRYNCFKMRPRMKTLLAILLGLTGGFSGAAEPGEKNPELSAQVKGIFKARCVECHSGTDAESGFDVLNFKQIFSGRADSGKDLVNSGAPETSFLISQVQSTPAKTAPMPPKKKQ